MGVVPLSFVPLASLLVSGDTDPRFHYPTLPHPTYNPLLFLTLTRALSLKIFRSTVVLIVKARVDKNSAGVRMEGVGEGVGVVKVCVSADQ